jgi:hypothetical protein
MNTGFSWHHPKLFVAPTHIGLGVFTRQKIKRGCIVARLGGRVMSLKDESQLPDQLRDVCHQIDENYVYGPNNIQDIELTDHFNHSCDPNCGFKGQIFIVAMRDIAKGEELNFDYAMVLGSKTRYRLTCKCGSKNCRRTVTCNDWKLKKLQKAYKGFFQWYIEEKIKLKQ